LKRNNIYRTTSSRHRWESFVNGKSLPLFFFLLFEFKYLRVSHFEQLEPTTHLVREDSLLTYRRTRETSNLLKIRFPSSWRSLGL